MIDYIKKLLDNKRILIIALAIGILLIFISDISFDKTSKDRSTFDQNSYLSSLEKRVESIVSEISGAGECKVMINISSGCESVYVKENKKSYDNSEQNNKSESEDSVITMKDSDGNEFALVTKEIMPEISGVIVACKGANDIYVKNSVIQAVSTVLGVGTNKVCVIAKS